MGCAASAHPQSSYSLAEAVIGTAHAARGRDEAAEPVERVPQGKTLRKATGRPERRGSNGSKGRRGSKGKKVAVSDDADGGSLVDDTSRKARKARSAAKSHDSLPWLQTEAIDGPLSEQRVSVSSTIGSGLTATVQLGTLDRGSKWLVVKKLRKDKVLEKRDVRHVRWEKEALQALSESPFVVDLLGTYQTSKHLCLVLSYAPGGELFSLLRARGRLPLQEAKFYAAELLVAVEAVHDAGFAYRDLKPENVLLDERGHVKICDMGFARRPERDGRMRTSVGTPQYMSPEQLDAKSTHDGYTSAVDWWALGVLLFEMLVGRTPFARTPQDSRFEVYTRVIEGKMGMPRGMDADAKALLLGLLAGDPQRRLTTAPAIKRCAFFGDVDWAAVADRRIRPPHVPQVKYPGDAHNFDQLPEADDGAAQVPAKVSAAEFKGW